MDKIITCIDGSAITQSVTEAGVWAAKKLMKTLTLLHTIEKHHQHGADNYSGAIGLEAQSKLLDEIAQLDEQKNKLAMQLGNQLLDSMAATARGMGIEDIEKLQRHGDIVEAICTLDKKTRFIVMGRKGSGHEGKFKALGSHIETLLRKASHPVLIVPDKFSPPSSFMIAYDGRGSADRALEKVIEGGLLHGLHCHLVSIKNGDTAFEERFNIASNRLKENGFTVTSSLLEGKAHDAIIQYQVENQVNLVMMGAFGHSMIRQLFVGSTTLKVLEKIDVPLIILR